MSDYKLKTGQINFENKDFPGAFSCVVIKNGTFHNMTDHLLSVLEQAISDHKAPEEEMISLEDML